MNSPFMERLCRALDTVLDERTEVGRRVLEWPGDPHTDAMPMRVTGGLNALRRTGRAPGLTSLYPPAPLAPLPEFEQVLSSVLGEFDQDLLPWLDGPPQTNETGRAGALFPGLMLIAARTGLPLRLFELGASAGLNLRLDDYAYRLGGIEAGRTGSPVRIEPQWSGSPPLSASLEVAERRGVDMAPLDVTDPDVRERLMAFCWPDQSDRVTRLEAALDLAAKDPPPIDKGDAADWTERMVEPRSGTATVVFHSIAFQYFPEETKRRIEDHLHRRGTAASADAPLFWLQYEAGPGGPGQPTRLGLRSWPEGGEEHLAEGHPHGTDLHWHAD
ncbi:hypothetical protein B5C34_03760 [Pacificimonas flava]|uniref:DUF2332 domain-containing protein n=2 Tax=Pacificimonas TaxID=1960290 RepID=A0A219B8B2_9SPHN|nr:hypothetical protein B5C34_03760 [Pacificimonas flava]